MTQTSASTEFDISPELLQAASAFVQKDLQHVDASHDWTHIQRVEKLAGKLLKQAVPEATEAVQHLVSLCAMLHDVDDWKYCSMAAHVSQKRSIAFLESLGADQAVMDTVAFVLDRIGFKESLRSAQAPDGGPACGSDTAELVLHIVQDADRLDALGAIGIARCFTFGGAFKRTLYDPEIPPRATNELTKEAYMKDGKKGTTINHFHEKLLKLQGLMNTEAGVRLAKERTEYMVQFLDRFKSEWDASDLRESQV